MPPARHHARWHLLVTDLAHAAEQAVRILDEHPVGQDTASRDAQLWPYLKTWGEHDVLLRDLALQSAHPPETHTDAGLGPKEQDGWTEWARSARSRDLIQPRESLYDASGRQLTVAYVPDPADDGEEVVLILAGDIDSPQMRVIGRYDTDDEAIRDLPPAVPPGVLYPDGPPPGAHPLGISVDELTCDVIDSKHSGDVAGLIFHVASQPPHAPPGQIAQLTRFLDVCADWAAALDTRAGRDIAVRLRMLSAQTGHLAQDLAHVGEQLEKAVAVLPPHRTPAPRHLSAPRTPGVTTTPVAPAPPASAASARRR
ncbi:hypothetical protein ABT083_13305 [Streptomyces goshikiensis]|uniref:hypothetical protein n=1 Tax=Streptomyces goshikiensis TaxID=1942 RepID=UPI003327DCD9